MEQRWSACAGGSRGTMSSPMSGSPHSRSPEHGGASSEEPTEEQYGEDDAPTLPDSPRSLPPPPPSEHAPDTERREPRKSLF